MTNIDETVEGSRIIIPKDARSVEGTIFKLDMEGLVVSVDVNGYATVRITTIDYCKDPKYFLGDLRRCEEREKQESQVYVSPSDANLLSQGRNPPRP